MTELIRPALYQAVHHIDALTSDRPPVKYDVVGPICETSDTFRNGMMLPELKRGDLVAIRSAGAYRSEEHTSELQSRGHLVCRLLLEKKKTTRPSPSLPAQRGTVSH